MALAITTDSMPPRQVVTLPRLRIPTDSDLLAAAVSQQQQQLTTPQWHRSLALQSQMNQQQQLAMTASYHQARTSVVPVAKATPSAMAGPLTRSPSSPAAFFQDSDNKFGLTHLLEAAEQCLPVPVTSSAAPSQQQSEPGLRKRSFSEHPLYFPHQHQQISSHHHQQFSSQQQHAASRMPPLAGFLAQDDAGRSYKRARPELSGDFQSQQQPQSYRHEFQSLATQPQTSLPSSFGGVQFHPAQPAVPTPTPTAFRSPTDIGGLSSPASSSGSGSPSGVPMPSMIWETVLTSGKFPSDVSLSETPNQLSASKSGSSGNGAGASASNGTGVGNPVKQGRWTCDEKEFAEALIQAVRNGEAVLPPNMSLRKFIAESLQCKAMRVSKKFRSLRACQSPTSPTAADDSDDTQHEKRFNPLSLSSIMNSEGAGAGAAGCDSESLYHSAAAAVSAAVQQQQRQAPAMEDKSSSSSSSSGSKKAQRVLKRSDYSQHGMVRSGRWSLEEETYAKAMIEAFKAGYLPLHGNVSLRKFLSEVLVCHPMRISKKFVGYVRKYHWYRIAAGKCDPEAKQRALEQLAHLERAFWASMQQSSDWAMASAASDSGGASSVASPCVSE